LAGLLLGYIATRTTGIPILDPDPGALDAAGIATNVVESLGLPRRCGWSTSQPAPCR
jgi:hypothetical protein